jgi:Zn-dependent membrane protease YugP
MFFDPIYFVFIAPAFLLALWAQFRVKSTYAAASQVPADLSGAAAARYVLDSAGLNNVPVEQVEGFLSDHYDPRHKVLRLSPDVYHGRNMAAVGIAAHEAGHALQDAYQYAPLGIRNAAVPVASFGSGIGILVVVVGAMMQAFNLILIGIVLYSGVVFFQLINLPVEFNASSRAKQQLVSLGIVPAQEMGYVNKVLNAAALTYVAATLEAIMVLLYLIFRFGGGSRSND